MSRLAQSALAYLRSAAPQLIVLAVVLAADRLVSPHLFDVQMRNGRLVGVMVDILNRAAPVGLLALGMSLVIAVRGVDLSVGAVMAIAGAVLAASAAAGLAWPLALTMALGIGAVCGAWNGALVALLGMEPIVATLALMVAGRGVAQLITKGQILTFSEPHLAAIGGGVVAGVPTPIMIVLGAAVLALAVVRATALGLFVEALGGNARASRLSGLSAAGVTVAIFVASGLFAGLAGAIAASDIRGADANNAGLWLELDAILSAVVGGASLLGGRFSLSRALLGAVSIQAMKTGILLAGFPSEFNLIVMAAAVFAVLCIQSPRAAKLWPAWTARRRSAA